MTTSIRSMREAWGGTLIALGHEDPRTVVLDGDLASSTKADAFATAFPERFLQMGIAEQNLVGVAAGLATTGLVPWLSSFGVFFSHRALDPIRMLVAQTDANVKIAAGYTGVCFGMAGKSHHDHADLAVLRAMPRMTVLAPGDAAECEAMTRWAHEYHGPVYLRLARDPGPALPGGEPRIGEVRVLRDGGDGVLVSTGAQTARTLEAAGELAADGLDLRVLHVPTVKPFDEKGLIDLVGDAPFVVTVEEHSTYGGLGGMVAEATAAGPRPLPVHRIALEDTWVETGSNAYLLDTYGLSARAVAARVARLAGVAA
ncbi:transketolase family protein [Streptomyces sp. 3N207]|uniref:transketolase family protein n=1 Tax=Streptomyces sp. 3N207 TaxID=3457417 RepID=UPI003FD4FFE6